jgi:hypothetical protein
MTCYSAAPPRKFICAKSRAKGDTIQAAIQYAALTGLVLGAITVELTGRREFIQASPDQSS